jgi:hypothetical protein
MVQPTQATMGGVPIPTGAQQEDILGDLREEDEYVDVKQPGARYDARFWMIDDNGELVERPGAAQTRESEAAAGLYRFPMHEQNPLTDPQAKLWWESQARQKKTKRGRRSARLKRMHAKAMQESNIADQMRANQPTWMNVQRMPGEPWDSYAARYAAFAQMMGQGMGRSGPGGGGDNNALMGQMLNYMLGQQQGRAGQNELRAGLLSREIETIGVRLDQYDAVAQANDDPVPSLDPEAIRLRARRDKVQADLDRILEGGGVYGGGYGGGIYGGGYGGGMGGPPLY